MFLLSAFVIVYIIIQLVSGLTTDVSYEYALTSTVDDTLEKTAYIIRNEKVLYAETEGILNYSVSESERIGSSQLIATVFSDEQGIEISSQIKKIDDKIAILKRSFVDTSYLTSNVSKIDTKIYNSLMKIRNSVLTNNLELSEQYQEDLIINFNKRQYITSGQETIDDQIAALENKKSELVAQFQNPTSTVYAKDSGYFSTLLDGYETIYTPEKIKSMSVDSFNELITETNISYEGNAIGKIITDFDWYTLCLVSQKEAAELTLNQSYPITFLFSSGYQLHGILEKKITQTNLDSVVLVFRIEEVPVGFDYTRMQTIRIILDSQEGISFPRSALRYSDGIPGVYVVSGNSVGFKKIDVIYSTESLYFSDEKSITDDPNKEYLTKFDRVITKGKNLYVGKVLD